MKKTVIALILILSVGAAYAQHSGMQGMHGSHDSHASHDEKAWPVFKTKNMAVAFEHYIHLKNALTASEIIEAKDAASELFMSLESIKNASQAYSEANKVTAAISLDDQRAAFSGLSNEMYALAKQQLVKGEIFVNYCPMAFNNSGAYWMSETAMIKNPYFGESMLNCGKVEEVLQKGQKASAAQSSGGGGHHH